MAIRTARLRAAIVAMALVAGGLITGAFATTSSATSRGTTASGPTVVIGSIGSINGAIANLATAQATVDAWARGRERARWNRGAP